MSQNAAIENESSPVQGAQNWASRSEYWLKRQAKSAPFRAKRQRAERPLILCGHGVSLRIDNGTLLIKNGFTHFPQKQEIYRYFPGDLDIPPRIIMLDCSGSLSFHVLTWLRTQKVDLIQLAWDGEVVSTVTGAGYSCSPEKVQWQRDTRDDPERRMAFCLSLIQQKIESSLLTLAAMNTDTLACAKAMQHAERALATLREKPPADIASLRTLEGNCAAAYFRAWKGIPLTWKKASLRLIPPEWQAIAQRRSPFHNSGNFKAKHPVNAILNYAYQVAKTEVLIKAISEGYDPTIGIMHEGGPYRNAFVYDLIELERADIDRKVFHFLKSHMFDAADFSIGENGVVRLNPQMASVVVSICHGRQTYLSYGM